MSGFGMGLAGFAAGLSGGLTTGARLADMVDEHKLRQVREQGILEAQAMQAKATPQVTDNGDMQNLTSRPQASADPNAAPTPPAGHSILAALNQTQPEQPLSDSPQQSRIPGAIENPMASGIRLAEPKRFNVGGKEFDKREDADAASKAEAPDLETFYAKTLVPRMKDKLMEMGRADQAAAWEKYAEEKTTKAHMKTWAKAFGHAQGQDYMGAASELMKLYPDYDDGFELLEATPQKGDNGLEGFLMRVRDADGNERTVFHDAKSITEVGLAQLQPIEMFQQRFKRQQQADMLQAKSAEDAKNDERSLVKSLSVEAVRQFGQNGRQDKKLTADEQAREDKQQNDKERDAVRGQQRLTQLERREQLRVETEAKKLASGIKKGDSPEKQYMAARAQVMKNPMAATMSGEEVDAEARNILDAAKRFATEQAPAAPAGGMAANPVAQNKGVPVFRNGKIEYR